MSPRSLAHSSSRLSFSSASDADDSSVDEDEDELNTRLTPHWPSYRDAIEARGFLLDTYRDVKQFYERYWEGRRLEDIDELKHRVGGGYQRACNAQENEDALCRDAGLPERLFRGTRASDGKKIVVKAVCSRSRELEIIRTLSSEPLRSHHMNHTIPVLDLIEIPNDKIAFIVQEEWSPYLIAGPVCSLRTFLRMIRSLLEGLVFMHMYRIAHLDISLRNLLSDNNGHYCYIDFEMSRRFDLPSNPSHSHSNNTKAPQCQPDGPRISGYRGTEIPPEVELGQETDPFKVDVWAFGVLILRLAEMSNHSIPELVQLTSHMLADRFEDRPTACQVLKAFDDMVIKMGAARLHPHHHPHHHSHHRLGGI